MWFEMWNLLFGFFFLQGIQENILIANHKTVLHQTICVAGKLKTITKVELARAFKYQLYGRRQVNIIFFKFIIKISPSQQLDIQVKICLVVICIIPW